MQQSILFLASSAGTQAASFPWISVLICIAVLASVLVWLVPALHTKAREFSLGVSALIFVLFLVAAFSGFDAHNSASVQLSEQYSWIPQIGVTLAWGVNGLGLAMLGLATFLVPLVVASSWHDFDDDDFGGYGYYGWVMALEAIMIGIFAARDVFVFYILFEVMIVPMYFLIGRYGKGVAGAFQARKAAMKFVVYSLVGGLIMLVGVIGVYVKGSGGKSVFLIDNLSDVVAGSSTVQTLLFLSFFLAFAIKAPMFPLHTWLPDAAAASTPGTSTLLVGVLDKIGTFGMVAIALPLFPEAAQSNALWIMVLAVISILWGGFMAVSEKNLLRMISYTSVSHFGFIVLGIFSGSSAALAGAILYMVAHGVATGGLFLAASFLNRRGSSYAMADYGGWQRVTPLIAGFFLIAGLASLALPGLSGFVPEYLILVGTFSTQKVLGILAVFGVILAAIYILWPYQKIFTGPKPDSKVTDMDGRERTVAGILIAAMAFLGFVPGSVLDIAHPVADQTVSTVFTAHAGAESAPALDTFQGGLK